MAQTLGRNKIQAANSQQILDSAKGGDYVKFAEGGDADMYAKTGIQGYGVTDETVKMVEKLRGQDKLDPSYPDNYKYYKKQGWQGPWYYETANFSSNDSAATDKKLREQYRQYGTGTFYTTGNNGEKVANNIVRVPKGNDVTPKSIAKDLEKKKSTIRKWKATKNKFITKVPYGRSL